MEFIANIVSYYANATLFSWVAALGLPTIYLWSFLIASIVGNFRTVQKKIADEKMRRRYYLSRIPYLIAFFICSSISWLALVPVITADSVVQTTLGIELCLIGMFIFCTFCLYRLEAGV